MDIGHEKRHQEVGEQLRRQVADRLSRRTGKQALVRGQPKPFVGVCVQYAVPFGMVHHNRLGRPQKDVPIHFRHTAHVEPGEYGRVEALPSVTLVACVLATDEAFQEIPQQFLVYRHEETDQVALEHPSLLVIVAAHALHTLGHMLNGLLRPALLSAVERHVPLLLEAFLEQRIETQAYPMMDDAVSEVGCEHLPQLGVVNQESMWTYRVGTSPSIALVPTRVCPRRLFPCTPRLASTASFHEGSRNRLPKRKQRRLQARHNLGMLRQA